MDTESPVPAVLDPQENVNLVALTPADMVPAQHGLIAWCDQKILAMQDEVDELEMHQRLAEANGWKTSVVEGNLRRARRRVEYYGKMRAALQAGYLLVPNMPVDILAIRVKRDSPITKTAQSQWRAQTVSPESLPAGDGRYVDEQAFTRSFSRQEKNYKGEMVPVTYHQTTDFDEVDFPIQLTKPVVLERVAAAMALRVFDTIGLVQNGTVAGATIRRARRGDPIYVGQILDPRGQGRGATFFLAWWVDTSTL